MKILVSDAGGTHIRLALVEARETAAGVPGFVIRDQRTYESALYARFEDPVVEFQRELGIVAELACFSVAGPVVSDKASFTNRPWKLSVPDLVRATGIARIFLLNDLEAAAHGIAELEASDLVTLQAGTPDPSGNIALLSAGTGLGESLAYRGDGVLRVLRSEGGHADFAPRTALQAELWQFLHAELDHVSWERVLSGPGLERLFQFLYFREHQRPPGSMPSAPAISRSALEGTDRTAKQAVELFVELFAGAAGNVALHGFASGGVFLAGGIAPSLLEWLRGPAFLEHFSNRGRMSGFLKSVPVQVITSPNLGLLGAARFAWDRASEAPESKAGLSVAQRAPADGAEARGGRHAC